jgi:hypothetical protein
MKRTFGYKSFFVTLIINIFTCVLAYLSYRKGRMSFDAFCLSAVFVEVAYIFYLFYWGLIITIESGTISFNYVFNIFKKSRTSKLTDITSIRYRMTSSRLISSVITVTSINSTGVIKTTIYNSFMFKWEMEKMQKKFSEVLNITIIDL